MYPNKLRVLSAVALSAALAGHFAIAHADRGDTDHGHHVMETETPIKHLIVIIGENHTFDNLFGGYRPPKGQTVKNLLAEGIINADGTPGPNFAKAAQQQASNPNLYRIDPQITGPYATLPQPNTTYASGQPPGVPDSRFPADLPNGPFQITKYVSYDAHVGDPAHRFFQMWQQYNEGKSDLFTWVGQTVGIGPQNTPPVTPVDTYQGGVSMGFYNMSTGDAPQFDQLARRYALADNYHQAIMGGTGANFFAIVTGDVAFHTDANGKADMPPANQIENPNPLPGTNNFYTQDGYAGGSYVECADRNQPGVGPIMDFINSQPGHAFRDGNCAPNTYYLVNNYGTGYTPTGTPKPLGPTFFTLPPQTVPNIADALSAKGVSWKWYSGGRNNGNPTREYCSICDPLIEFRSIMTTSLKDNLQGMTQFYQDVQSEKTMPAVAFIRPYESKAGHPANATMSGYEQFVVDVINRVKANKKLWAHTAILVTTDEGGGYYDSGYIQPVDFFGDGTRIPMLAVSPFSKKGVVDHTYYDHASILKFIEMNWGLHPLSERSRDNLPNPVARHDNPYVPMNRPAIGDLTGLFNFGQGHVEWSDRQEDHEDH